MTTPKRLLQDEEHHSGANRLERSATAMPAKKDQHRDPLDPDTHFGELERALDRLDPAWAKAALFFRSDCQWHFGHRDKELRARSLLAIHQELEARRKRYEADDNQELLHAIMLCAQENLPLPTWLATAYMGRLQPFLQPGGPVSLDDVFGSDTMPTSPTQGPQARRDWQIGVRIWSKVREIAAQHGGLDPAVRAVLDADPTIGVELTKAKDLVWMIDKNQTELVPGFKPLSQLWAKPRKRVTK